MSCVGTDCHSQLRQQALALQKAAAASEQVQGELHRQLDHAKHSAKELQQQLEAHKHSSHVALSHAKQMQQDLEQQLAEVTQSHKQEAQQHRWVWC